MEKNKKNYWLVVSAPLKNISQWEGLSHILGKNKKCLKPPTRLTLVSGKSPSPVEKTALTLPVASHLVVSSSSKFQTPPFPLPSNHPVTRFGEKPSIDKSLQADVYKLEG